MDQSACREPSVQKLNLLTGYRFDPFHAEALVYLNKEILGEDLPAYIIPRIDVYSYGDPHQIPLSEFKHGPDGMWFFFSNRLKENPGKTTNGRWQEIGDEPIFNRNVCVGFVKKLAFYFANPEVENPEAMKKEWYIHEYRANPELDQFKNPELVDAVKEKISSFGLCKVFVEEKVPSRPPSESSSDDIRIVSVTGTEDQRRDNEVENGTNS